MAFSTPSLLSSCSAYRLNHLLFTCHRFRIKLSHSHLKPRYFAVAARENGVFVSPETAKSFDFTAEERIYNWWDSQGYFKPNLERGSDPFVISMPPPNVTGSLHMGHAMFVTLEDIMARYHRMKGRPTLWLPGTDHAGIATQFDKEEALLRLPLPECWVVSKLHCLIDMVTTSYDKYFFGDVGRETYDFFWGDFADWYIEASKARLYHSGGHSVAQAVLLYVFENILKMLHPFMPFVTEALWQALPNRKEALIVSSWPQTSLPMHASSIKKFENLQSLTRAIRNARAEYSVEPAKRISASVVAGNEVLQYISKEKEVLALLSRLDLQNIHFTDSPPGDANQSVHLVAGEGLEAYLPLSDMVDVSAEVERLSKRLSKMQEEFDRLAARLSSPKFVEKAPEEVVNGVREKAAEAEEKIILTKNRLVFLKSTALASTS